MMGNTLTVIIPVYNGMPYLKEAVESILRQTHTDFRLLIVNDGSTDTSADYLASLTDPRVEVKHQSNMGEAETCNRAVASVDSEFVAFLHQDDIAMPDRLQKQMDFLVGHPDYVCVMSNFVRFSGTRVFGSYWSNAVHEFSDYDSRVFGAITPSTLCCRMDTWLEQGGFRSFGGKGGADYDFLLRLEEKTKMAVFNTPLVRYRVHTANTSHRLFIDMQTNVRYIEALAQRRRAGLLEITFEEFTQEDNRTFGIRRWRRRLTELGKFRFRKAGILIGEGRLVVGAWHLVQAAVLSPRHALGRLFALRRDRMAREKLRLPPKENG